MAQRFRNLFLSTTLLVAGAVAFASPATQHKTGKRDATTAAPTPEPQAAAAPPAKNTKGYHISSPSDEADPVPLEGMLLPSTQYAVQDMYFFSPPQFPPRLHTTSTIYEEQSILIVPILRRYAISNEGNADVRFKMFVIPPNGERDEVLHELVLFSGKVTGKEQLLFPAEGLPAFHTDKGDTLGKYTLGITLHDQISGASETLEKTITVIPYEVPTLPEDFNADKWMMHYYTAPQPELALPALFELMQDVQSERIDIVTSPMLGFYNKILTDNPWLLSHFSTRLEESLDKVNQGGIPNAADVMLGLVLSFHLRGEQERPEAVSQRIWDETESNRQFDWGYIDPGTAEFIYYPQQLDYLWGQFFASASYAPIHRLIKVLFQDEEVAAAEAPQAIRDFSEEQRTALAQAVLQATQWSLTSNARQQRLVLAYLFGTSLRPDSDFSEEQRKHLQAMVLAIIQIEREAREESKADSAPDASDTPPSP